MKALNNIFIILLAASIVACTKEVKPIHLTPPQVNFTMESTEITANIGDEVTFSVDIVEGDRLSAGWYIDGTMMSSGETFRYVFDKAGEYDVDFIARNGEGEVSKTYHVTVSDKLVMHLSVEDSTMVDRLQATYLKLMAIVDYGSNVSHQWSVDGEVMSSEAYFDTFYLSEAKTYTVSYKGSNAVGEFTKTFKVNVLPQPLKVEFSNVDDAISTDTKTPVELTATVVYGEVGLAYRWMADNEVIAEGSEKVSNISYTFKKEGTHYITYTATNSKGESVTRSWRVNVTFAGYYLIDDFESSTSLASWWQNGNNPGISIVDNPLKSGINTSDKVIIDQVLGSGSTSGFFTLKLANFTQGKDIDLSIYKGIRFKVYLGQNDYYPKISIGSASKKSSIEPPKHEGTWEILTYSFEAMGVTINNNSQIQFRPMSQENGSNITGGNFEDPTNSRTVYLDDFELLEEI